jgi:hypothetical protein
MAPFNILELLPEVRPVKMDSVAVHKDHKGERNYQATP